MNRWSECYTQNTERYIDSSGNPPRHTFFYPIEQYNEEVVSALAKLCASTGCETEIHLHHNEDTPENLHETLIEGKAALSRHRLLSADNSGNVVFGFIHGNWALANCDPRGINCGVTEEIEILQQSGCYADFTMPSAPHPTQPKTINSIYYSTTKTPRPLDNGKVSAVGQSNRQGLLMIQGPLALNWQKRKWGIFPRIENGSLTGANPPTSKRMRLWEKMNIQVSGQQHWTFIKLYTHGALPLNQKMLLGQPMAEFYHSISQETLSDKSPKLHYATAREMVNIIHAAEDGMTGNPSDYRDYRYRSIMTGAAGNSTADRQD
ncbi:MAG: hypothetical protein GY899_09645 [Verrucomicrobiaceae bacterium]|nr:hypothetical protein [Verrucomicrobiaceae bacterium]